MCLGAMHAYDTNPYLKKSNFLAEIPKAVLSVKVIPQLFDFRKQFTHSMHNIMVAALLNSSSIL